MDEDVTPSGVPYHRDLLLPEEELCFVCQEIFHLAELVPIDFDVKGNIQYVCMGDAEVME